MARRWIPQGPASYRLKAGYARVFNPDHTQPDGTTGYTQEEYDQIADPNHKKGFRMVEVTGDTITDPIVEEATAAPGAKRSTPPKKKTPAKK